MASSDPPDTRETYSTMSVGDVEAIGAHCQMPFCHQLDFLPFRCDSCKGKFCLDHRTETAHQCPQAGAWARRRSPAASSSSTTTAPSPARPHILTHEHQCAAPACRTLINTPLVTGVQCDRCNRSYCLKHRFAQDHDCARLTPLGARPTQNAPAQQKERGLAALERLRAWGAAKRGSASASASASASTSTSSTAPSTAAPAKSAVSALFPPSRAKQSAASALAATAALKRAATGDDRIPRDRRVYLHVEASADTLTARLPRGDFFYSAEHSVGRVLDLAAGSLRVQNVNNRSASEGDRLRVFHVEGGRLLDFGEKLGRSVQTGDTIVLLRGVGPGMAKTPEQTA